MRNVPSRDIPLRGVPSRGVLLRGFSSKGGPSKVETRSQWWTVYLLGELFVFRIQMYVVHFKHMFILLYNLRMRFRIPKHLLILTKLATPHLAMYCLKVMERQASPFLELDHQNLAKSQKEDFSKVAKR